MLYVTLEAGADCYAVAVDSVEQVVPFALLKGVPGAPPGVSGILNWRGEQVVVIDCCQLLAGTPCAVRRSSRIILVRAEFSGRMRRIGLLGENVTRTVRLEDEAFVPAAARAAHPECAGEVAVLEGKLVQLLHPESAISGEVLDTLLWEGESNDA